MQTQRNWLSKQIFWIILGFATVGSAQGASPDWLFEKEPINIFINPDRNPYDLPLRPSAPAEAVCAVRFLDDGSLYQIENFDDEKTALAAGFQVTHLGHCGTCSTLQDLGVYIKYPNLTSPVRSCAMRLIDSRSLDCLEALGFSSQCALTWFYNGRNTRKHCFWTCMRYLSSPNNMPDGSLNPCLACDEEISGPIFKATAGRTRRNSGLQSAIGRENGEIADIDHNYDDSF